MMLLQCYYHVYHVHQVFSWQESLKYANIVTKAIQVSFMCQLFFMVWEEERKRRKRKKRHGGENEEELGGIGLFGPVARISNSEEKAQPARQ